MPKRKQKTSDHIRAARKDPAYFAEHILGFSGEKALTDKQVEVLRAARDTATIILIAGRGVGKSSLALMWLLWRSFRWPGHIGIWIAGREGQSKYASAGMRTMIRGTLLEADLEMHSEGRIKFKNTSVVHFLPGNEDAARGAHEAWSREGEAEPTISLVIDECASVQEATWTAALGQLTSSTGARAFLTGSPRGKEHWSFREFGRGLMDENKDRIKSFQISAETEPYIDQQRLADMKASLDPIQYGSEILGQFQDAMAAYFTDEDIEGATQPFNLPYLEPELSTYEKRKRARLAYRPYPKGWNYFLGIDLSESHRRGSDYTAYVVIARERRDHSWPADREQKMRIVYIERHEQARSPKELTADLGDICQMYPRLAYGVCERFESLMLDGIVRRTKRSDIEGKMRWQRGTGKVPLSLYIVDPTNERKHLAFSLLHQVIRDKILELPMGGENAQALRHELRNISYHFTKTSRVTFAAMGNEKDDIVMAMLWGVAWITGLQLGPKTKSIRPQWDHDSDYY